MKKVFIMAAIALMATANVNAEEKIEDAVRVDYNIDMNIRALSRCLNLSGDQVDAMVFATDLFKEDLTHVKYAKEEKKAARLQRAISRNLAIAHKHLEEKQYHDYLVLMNTTLNNKGLSTLLRNDELASK